MGKALPLPAITGNQWDPVWAKRPGSYEALKGLEDCMPLWLLLHSRNADAWKPCYASRASLGMTIGLGTRTVTRQLARLSEAALVYQVDHGPDRTTKRHRPPARWALDPMMADLWRSKMEAELARAAESHGHGTRWYNRALRDLDTFDRRSRRLANQLEADMPVKPRRRKTKKGPRAKLARGSKGKTASKRKGTNRLNGAASQIYPTRQNGPPGDVSTTGEVVGTLPWREPGRNGSRASE